MLKRAEMGKVTVDFVVANNRDVITLGQGDKVVQRVKHLVVTGVVDCGAMRLVLPQRVVDALGLMADGETVVRFADNRREKRQMVSNVWLELLGRHSVFTAVVEPNRNDALIGALVLDELDLLVDCASQSLWCRDPDSMLTVIEQVA